MSKLEDMSEKGLTALQLHVLKRKGTEPPFSGSLVTDDHGGDYACAGCGNIIFNSSTSFESVTPGLIGWPSFSATARPEAVKLSNDYTLGMYRIEVSCGQCGGHLGHFFEDDAAPDGAHYCINSCVLVPAPSESAEANDR
jgi:peptide-methionine (R)-S-oxide reductase